LTAYFALVLGLVVVLPAQDDLSLEFKRVYGEGTRKLKNRHGGFGIPELRRSLEIIPNQPDAAYNLACAYTVQRDVGRATQWLLSAVQWGYSNLAHLERDSDLNRIREHPDYAKAVALLREKPADPEERALNRTLEMIVMIEGNIQRGGAPVRTNGAGIVFGKNGDSLLVATANHVVRSGGGATDLRVLFRREPHAWRPARLLPENDAQLDVAVISVEQPVEAGERLCSLPWKVLADGATVKRGSAAYPVGYPNAPWGMPVQADRVSQIVGDSISFQSSFIAKGHSGGALLTAANGISGMLRSDEPPYGVAIRIQTVLDLLRKWGFTVMLQPVVSTGETPLHRAVKSGALGEVRKLLNECADPNAATTAHWTPLHEAASRDSVEAAELLIAANANLYAWAPSDLPDGPLQKQRRRWRTPLHVAAERGATGVVQVLLRHGANPDVAGIYHELFSADRDVRHTSATDTPLQLAVKSDAVGAVKALLEGGALPEAQALCDSAMKDSAGTATLLLQHGAPVNGSRCFPLNAAAEKDAVKVAQTLLKAGADTKRGTLYYAAESGSLRVIEILLASGFDPNEKVRGDTAIDIAARFYKADVVELLVKAGARTSLHCALRSDQQHRAKRLKIAQVLLAAGAPVDEKNISGVTALYQAVEWNDQPMVKLLLQSGANINAADRNGSPVLLNLVGTRADSALIAQLISAGAQIEARDRNGQTALMLAAKYSDKAMFETLVKAGADVNAVDSSGDTVLHRLTEETDEAILAILKTRRPATDVRNESNQTALDRAVSYRKLRIERFIRELIGEREK